MPIYSKRPARHEIRPMNSRERVLAAVAHRWPDRMPVRFNGGGDEARRVAADLCLPLEGDVTETLQRHLRVDVRNVDSTLIPREGPNGGYPTEYDCLAPAETAADVDRLWPPSRRIENRTLAPAVEKVKAWDHEGICPAIILRTFGLMSMLLRARGQVQANYDLAEENAVFLRILDRTEEFLHDLIELGFKAFGPRLDVVYFGDELGMQTGLLYSPRAIEKHLLPRYARLAERVHRHGGKVFFHSCGAIEPVIDALIDVGVDILNPIQPKIPGMEPEHLARKFGGRVCFCGGIDMQRLLPFGRPDEVRAEVRRYFDVLAPGYILDFANILHPDIPTANVLAMYETPREPPPRQATNRRSSRLRRNYDTPREKT